MNYYTLHIQYGDSLKPSTVSMKDLHPDSNETEKKWMRELRENIWKTGFPLETSPSTIEFISPFRIHKVFLERQNEKYGV